MWGHLEAFEKNIGSWHVSGLSLSLADMWEWRRGQGRGREVGQARAGERGDRLFAKNLIFCSVLLILLALPSVCFNGLHR